MYPLISKPTRITSSTATLIENIFTNNLEQSMSSGILYTDLSDHLPIFQVTHLKLDVEPLYARRDWHALLTLQQLQHSGLEWKPLSGLKSVTLTLLMIPMIHSLAFLCQHTISHFHLNLYTLSAAVLQNPGLLKISLYPVTGRIFSINNSK